MNRVLLLLSASLLAFACTKIDASKNPNPDAFAGGESVSDDFSWSTTNDVRTEIAYSSEQVSLEGKVEILDKNFNPVVAWNKKAGEQSVMLKTIVPNVNDTLFVYSRDLRINHPFTADADVVDLNANGIISRNKKPKAELMKAAENCASNACDVLVSSNTNNLVVRNNETACVTANISGNIILQNNANVTICGNATINNLNIQGGSHTITISESGSLTMNNLNINSNTTFINHGVLNVSGSFNNNFVLVNTGVINASQTNINGSSQTTNSGTMNIAGRLNVNEDLDNSGSMNVAGDMSINGSSDFINGCQLIVSGNLMVNGNLNNQAFVKVTGKTTFNGGTSSQLQNGSIVVTRDLEINSSNLSSNGVGVIKVSDGTRLNGGARATNGFIDICDDNGVENDFSNANNNFLFCETNVNTDACISEGLSINGSGSGGSAQPFTVQYPSTGKAYRAFEDLWPSTGDYDFNDMLVEYTMEYSANENNQLTGIDLTLRIKAVGGSLKNGVALQLLNADLSRYNGQIFQSVSGGETASIASNGSTVIVTASVPDELPVFYSNTGSGNSTNDLYTINLSILVNPNSGVEVNDLVSDLFIFRADNPGIEIHMPGNPPSPAADQSLFNTFEDQTASRGFYKTKNNYPWAIEVSGSNVFAQPLEKVSISDAYPEFNQWVTSQGRESGEWYKTPILDRIF